MELLQERGAVPHYGDPYIPRLHKMRAHDFSHMTSMPLTVETLRNQDLVLITTDHPNIDYQTLRANSVGTGV
jgi:UDP-N-acetyl-D-glucosamine dehydrogenase